MAFAKQDVFRQLPVPKPDTHQRSALVCIIHVACVFDPHAWLAQEFSQSLLGLLGEHALALALRSSTGLWCVNT
ncbi:MULTISPECIES: hypothetical protein [Aminobacter]|uniref:hypothetical protein n=1 Tax=Aminobacter TaxID=31988 RepID=UPI0028569EE8|nr:hypothetical protein [Aminobacter aminovorans]MDR7222257.1 hypothetical protein [Aminobacter aminovorans]WMC96085.1 hypothetical protein RAR13_22355 [Aminobacter aminovorans]